MSDGWRMIGRGWFAGVPLGIYGEISEGERDEVLAALRDAPGSAFETRSTAHFLWTACVASAHVFTWYPSDPVVLSAIVCPLMGVPIEHGSEAVALLESAGLIELVDLCGVPGFRLLHEGRLWRLTDGYTRFGEADG